MKGKPSDGRPEMGNSEAAAEFIRKEHETIMSRWEERANKEVRAAGRAKSLVLRDDLPSVLKNLVDALDRIGPDPRQAGEEAFDLKISLKHGEERAATTAYTVGQVLQEYTILRQVLTDGLDREGLAEFGTFETINRLTEMSAIQTATGFTDAIQKRQNDLLATLAHDIRNQLSVALLNSQCLEEGNEIAKRIQNSIGQAVGLLEGVLDTASVDAGQALGIRCEKIDLREAVLEACEGWRDEAKGRVRLELPNGPLQGMFDRAAVRRIFDNLILNALKYGAEGTPATISLFHEEPFATITVHNEGPPIPAEEQKNIFEFFARGEARGASRAAHSWGLGLAYVRMAAEAHGGDASVESSEEGGTLFRVKLRRDTDED